MTFSSAILPVASRAKTAATLLAMTLGTILPGVSHAAAVVQEKILLTIDISDPGAVIIASTDETSEIDVTVSAWQGYTLLNFLTGTPAAEPVISYDSDLSETAGLGIGTSGERFLGIAAVDETNPLDPGSSLNFYNLVDAPASDPSAVVDYAFSASASAFQDAVSVDFTNWAALLPDIGSMGRIFAGDEYATGEEFGSWKVIGTPATIPLPAGMPLILTGLGLFGVMRRRKKA